MPEMESSPKQPENKREEPRGVSTARYWLKDWIFMPQESTISSIGEFLLPFLLGAMKSCWIAAILIGLSSIGLYESSEPLIPLWAPFILIIGSLMMFYYLGLRALRKVTSQEDENLKITTSETSLFIALIGVLSLFFVWLHVYAQISFFFDPKWLSALFKDIFLLDGHFYEAVIIVGLSFLLGWLGIRLINRQVEPSDVFRAQCFGLGVIIVVIILRTGQVSSGVVLHDDAVLLLLIPFFLFLSLATHALARVVFIRHSHPTGLQGSIVAQERAIIMLIGLLGLVFLFIALLVSSTLNPSFFQSLTPLWTVIGKVYNWLVEVVADLAVLIATPFFWLFYLFTRLFPPKAPSTPNRGSLKRPVQPAHNPNPDAALILPFVKIILPIVFLLFVFALIWWTLRRLRRIPRRVNRQTQDLHESLWSWSLFWTQLRAFLRTLFARFIRSDTTTEDSELAQEEIEGEPAARNIREIYRAFLKKANMRGYPRKRFETPYEFKQRIDEKVPLTEPQLEVITEAYAFTRYGGDVPDEAQLELVRSKWAELDQKWT
jgi:Domain of unknown function (DUF4129)